MQISVHQDLKNGLFKTQAKGIYALTSEYSFKQLWGLYHSYEQVLLMHRKPISRDLYCLFNTTIQLPIPPRNFQTMLLA